MHFGRYELLEKLASGGMGEVYLARASGAAGFSKSVAVKRINPHRVANEEYQRRFILEAKVAAELSHPNIVQVLDLGIHDGELFLAMEFVEGSDVGAILDALAKQQRRLSPECAAVLAFDVLEALDYAHARADGDGRPSGLVHRDVTPQNVLVSVHGVAKLCDFGIVRLSDRATGGGKLRGKVPYMSPEQARGESLDGRSDLYSLGIVLYEAMTSAPLFRGDDLVTLAARVEREAIPTLTAILPQTPQTLSIAIARALAKDRDQRFASAAEMRAAIETYLVTIDAAAARRALAALAQQHRHAVVAGKQPNGTESLAGTASVLEDGAASKRWTQLLTQMPSAAIPVSATLPLEAGRGRTARHVSSARRWLVGLPVIITITTAGALWLGPGLGHHPHPAAPSGVARAEPPRAAPPPEKRQEPQPEPSHATPSPLPGPVPRASGRRPKPAPVLHADDFGYISVNADPWAYITLDGRRLEKTTPLLKQKVSVGKHHVKLVGPTGKEVSFDLEVHAGEAVVKSAVVE